MNALPPDPVQTLRRELHDAGFRPVPVATGGKASVGKGWPDEARSDRPFCIAHPATVDAQNTGILCDGLRAIDVDIDDAARVARVVALAFARFGPTIKRFRANSPRCLLLYRAAEGEPGKRAVKGEAGAIEILGRGQQFVAFGTHPSGAPLQWTPEAPGDAALSTHTGDHRGGPERLPGGGRGDHRCGPAAAAARARCLPPRPPCRVGRDRCRAGGDPEHGARLGPVEPHRHGDVRRVRRLGRGLRCVVRLVGEERGA